MGASVSQLVGQVTIEGAETALSQLREIGQASEQVEIAFGHMSEAARQAASMASEGLSPLPGEIERIGTAAQEASSGFMGGWSGMAGGLLDIGSKIGMTIFGFQSLIQTAQQLGNAFLEPNASMEQTQVAFETLLGKGQKTQDFLKQLQQFAAATPFEFPELATDAEHMLAFGFNTQQVIPYLTAIGNALGSMGKGAGDIDHVVEVFGQMHAAGKLNASDMMQLTQEGIPAWKFLADAMGLSVSQVQKMTSQGLIPADKAIKAVTDGMQKTFGGGMAAQAQTFNGLLSTFQDNISAAWRAFTGPMFAGAKNALIQIGNLVSSKAFQDFATSAGQKIAGFFQAIASNGNILIPVLAGLGAVILAVVVPSLFSMAAGVIAATWPFLLIAGAVAGLVAIFMHFYQTNSGFKSFIDNLVNSLRQAWQAISSGFLPAMQQVGSVIQTKVWPILQQIGGWLLATFKPVWDQLSQTFQTQLLPAWNAIVSGLNAAKPVLILIAGVIGGVLVLALSAVVGVIKGVIEAFANLLSAIIQIIGGIAQIFGGLVATIGGILGFLADLITGHWSNLGNDLKTIWQGIVQTFSGLWNVLGGVVKAVFGTIGAFIGGFFSGFGGTLHALFGGIFAQIGSAIGGFFSGLGTRVHDALSGIGSTIGGVFSAIGTTVHNAVMGVVNWFIWLKLSAQIHWMELVVGIQRIVTGIKNWLLQTWQNIVNGVVAAFSWLYNHNYYFQALVDTIRKVISGVVTWLQTTWANITGWITNTWNMLKIRAEIYWMMLVVTIQTKIQQVVSFLQSIWTSITTWIGSKWQYLTTLASVYWSLLITIIQTKINQAVTWLQGVWNNVVTFLQGIWNTITTDAGNLWSKISSIFGSAWNTYIATPLSGLWNNFTSWAGNLASQAGQWGANLMQMFINGITGMIGNLQGALGNVMSTIAGWLGFHSPTKEGPGATADTWAPALMSMFAQGIEQGNARVRQAVGKVAGTLASGFQTQAQAAFSVAASTHFSLLSSAGSMAGVPSGVSVVPQSVSSPQHVIVYVQQPDIQLDGNKLTRAQVPYLVQHIRRVTGAKI